MKRGLTQLRERLVAKDGPLTRDLLREPGRFGLGQVPAKQAPDATTTLVCGFCSTGCGLEVHLREGRAVSLSPASDYPVNRGMACPKGWEALAPLSSPRRATHPLLRDPKGRLAQASWDQALREMVTRIRAVQRKHGPDAVAFLSTGQIPVEEMAALGVLTKLGMDVRHGDGNTRQCMATAVAAYKESFGFDAPPYSYRDLEESDVIVLWGSNLCVAHPVLWERVVANPHGPKVIVVDPRATETAMAATTHVPVRPKADLALAYGLAREIIAMGACDAAFVEAHCEGFDAFAAFVDGFTLERTSRETGLPRETIVELARAIGEGERVSLWWTMGVNQSHQGVRTAQALINLALMTGNIGRPGTGANSVTGQCNAMGSRLFSNTTNLIGGFRFDDPAGRSRVAQALGVDVSRIPSVPGLPYDRIVERCLDGRIKALWVIATNPAHSWINQSDLHLALSRLELLVVQDMYHSTETAELADIVLPAAAWGEKDGTFINSERRLGLIKRVAESPGEALSDFAIFKLVAAYWGCSEVLERWERPEDVLRTLAALTAGQPCDISGIESYQQIDEAGGIQWPFPAGAADRTTERRLFEDRRFFTLSGRARFVFEAPRRMPERPSRALPLLLLTGRGSASQWHTQTRTAESPVLEQLAPRTASGLPIVELHPRDAALREIQPGEPVRVRSARASVSAVAFPTAAVQPGQVFMVMHHPATNQLTFPAFDPISRQPAYKACAVDVERLEAWER